MRFSIFQDTALGARTSNQDRMGYCFTRDSLLMVLADGMGGHQRGEVAAQIAMQTAAAAFQKAATPMLEDPVAFLDQALRLAHHDILGYQALHHMPDAPRTTVVACVVQEGRAWWAHAGDSRLYWVRDGQLMARTRDHSKVEHMISLGQIAPHERDRHPDRNKVLNCLGSPFEPTIEIAPPAQLSPGDTLMLCSDGLWSAIPEDELCRRLASGVVISMVPQLVRIAVTAAGRQADNTTAVAMCWEGDPRSIDTLSSVLVPDGAVTTTIGFGSLDVEAPAELSEEEIERTISEIRSAIEKTATR